MRQDSLTKEIRAIRRFLAEQCGNDVRKIVAEGQRLESADGWRYQTLARRPLPQSPPTAIKPVDYSEPEADSK